jgi:type IV pilus assembly protein PilC
MTPQQKAQFFSQLGTLLESGCTVPDSLERMINESYGRLERPLSQVSVAATLGEDLASALAHAPRCFDQWTIRLIQVAQDTGNLPETCQHLATAAQQQEQNKKLFRSVLVVAWTTFFFIFLLGIVLMYSSHFVLGSLTLIAILLIVLAMITPQAANRFPLVSQILMARSMLQFTELELPLRYGIPILTAIELVRDHIPKSDMSASLTIALGQIPAGKTLAQSLEGRLPVVALRMIHTGEETGHLKLAVQKLAVYYQKELEQKLQLTQRLLIPISLLAAGAVIMVLGVQAITSLFILFPD